MHECLALSLLSSYNRPAKFGGGLDSRRPAGTDTAS